MIQKSRSFSGERDLNESIIGGASGKAAKSNRCRARGRSMARQRGLPPFFPSGAFPEEPRGAVFHSYFHGRDPFIEGCNATLQESISNGASRAALPPPLFPLRVFP